jgi:hypothetical protein
MRVPVTIPGRSRVYACRVLLQRSRIASPGAALALGLVVLALGAGLVPLSILGHRHSLSDAVLTVTSLTFAVVGLVVARHLPRNPLGWLLLAQAALFMLSTDAALYSMLHYRLGYDGLPLGWVAVLAQSAWAPGVVVLGLAVLLLPDGRLPSPRWRWVWRSLIALGALCTAGALAIVGRAIVARNLRIDPGGAPAVIDHATGAARLWAIASFVFFVLLLLSVVAWLVGQIASYRRASGDRRLQLKWLLSGGAIFVVCALVNQAVTTGQSDLWQAVGNVVTAGEVALPLCMGVAILRFRLYEIDRLISRTVTYAIVTGLLAGVFVAGVVLLTDVLPFSSPVGLAASTLAAVALFNPLRGRVQHAVDRRFNRARYDAEATVAAFTVRLQHAVDLDTVRNELLQTVGRSLEPANASLWTPPPSAARRG